jgi:hypothetical protein
MKKYDHTQLIAEWQRMGMPITEVLTGYPQRWMHEVFPTFAKDKQYRIKCKPWINWEHVSEEFNYLVVTNTGIPLLVSGGIPIRRYSEFSGDYWLYDIESKVVSACGFASFTPGTCDWKDALVMRPVVVGEEK